MFGLQKGGLDRESSLPLLSLGSPGQRDGDVRQKYPPLGIRIQSPAQGGLRLRGLEGLPARRLPAIPLGAEEELEGDQEEAGAQSFPQDSGCKPHPPIKEGTGQSLSFICLETRIFIHVTKDYGGGCWGLDWG